MNTERIQAAIELMKAADNLYMDAWQSDCTGYGLDRDEEEKLATDVGTLHACGNQACFAGYLALSPEFQAAGGEVGSMGEPMIRNEDEKYLEAHDAVAYYLGIDRTLTQKLLYGDATSFIWRQDSDFYGKKVRDVTPADVIAKLELILAGELS